MAGEGNSRPEFNDVIVPLILNDGLTYHLAKDMVTGEIEMDAALIFPTDLIAFEESCELIRDKYGIDQPFLEQILEEAKVRVRDERRAGIPYFDRFRR
jgi:hypothetical protein